MEKTFRHRNIYISGGKLCYFLMEQLSGSGQAIYLQTYDLGIGAVENQAPFVAFTNPSNVNHSHHEWIRMDYFYLV